MAKMFQFTLQPETVRPRAGCFTWDRSQAETYMEYVPVAFAAFLISISHACGVRLIHDLSVLVGTGLL